MFQIFQKYKFSLLISLSNLFVFLFQEENNNTVQLPPGDGGGPGGGTGPPGHLVSSTTQPSPVTGSGTGNLSKNPVTCALLNAASRKYTIAAANPLLAGGFPFSLVFIHNHSNSILFFCFL